MQDRRVGFLGDDDALFVELALRGGGLAVTRVDHVEQLSAFDIALLAVPPEADARALARTVPAGPAVVLLTHEGRGVPGATVVCRPCSLRTLLDVLWGTDEPGIDGDLVITLDHTPPTPAPPLFTATGEATPSRSRSREDGPG